jgi:hypothetical protein
LPHRRADDFFVALEAVRGVAEGAAAFLHRREHDFLVVWKCLDQSSRLSFAHGEKSLLDKVVFFVFYKIFYPNATL